MTTQKTRTPIARIRPGVKAFIVHQGKILVVKERITRPNQPLEIMLDLPGGGIELGESFEEALKREVFEEVGLQVAVERPVGGWEFFIEKPTGSVHIVCVGFQCSVIGEPVVDTSKNPAKEDIFEVSWHTKAELLEGLVLKNKQMIQSLENVIVS